jgi:hypothetical protein
MAIDHTVEQLTRCTAVMGKPGLAGNAKGRACSRTEDVLNDRDNLGGIVSDACNGLDELRQGHNQIAAFRFKAVVHRRRPQPTPLRAAQDL